MDSNCESLIEQRRLCLQHRLESIKNVKAVYFQPPENLQMKFPCIVYERGGGDTIYASNMPYRFVRTYSLTVIDADPDSEIPDLLAMAFPMIRTGNVFITGGRYHHKFTLYH